MSERQNLVSPQGGGGEFMTSLFGCFSDISVCIITLFLPCYQGAQNKAKSDHRECHFCDFCCWNQNIEYYTRQQIRHKYGMGFSQISDSCIILFCGSCATCQHANELAARG